MSTDEQFPPSSPFLDHHEHHEDPFNSVHSKGSGAGNGLDTKKTLVMESPFKKELNKELYPTPFPSSSTGVSSSSPSRSNLNYMREASRESHKDEPAQPAAPTKRSLQVRLLPNTSVSLGRSSRCDYFIKSKFASREHLNLNYNSENEEISIKCLGHNGVLVKLPQPIFGFINQINKTSFSFQKLIKPKSNDEIFNEISVFKGEILMLPFIEGIKFDIRGFEIEIDVVNNDESETEDELPLVSTNERLSSIEPMKNDELAENKKQIKDLEVVQTPKKESKKHTKKNNSNGSDESVNVAVEVPIKVSPSSPIQVKSPKFQSNSVFKAESSSDAAPLKEKSDSHMNQRRRKAEPGISPIKRKINTTNVNGKEGATSTKANNNLTNKLMEAAQPAKKHLEPKQKIENLNIKQITSEIQNLDDIKNVLTNHLAFSRLSQTPLKQLNDVSKLTAELSRSQLRAVLNDIPCIGIIYREGKDAAGKPLDEEYYYDVDLDQDKQRVQLVSSIKGSSGLRNCRKTHKQYFWKKPTAPNHKK